MRYLSIWVLVIWLSTCATAPGSFDANEPPMDGAVLYGKLANGFTYYVRPNKKPENRAHLSLVVRFGSLHEEDDERGLAHLIEHMAFNGTKRFAKNEIVKYFERIGMRFGDGLNAYTSFEETNYFLEIPLDDPTILETSFQILEDWSRGVSFDPAELEKEKGVIEEEWRLGRDVNGRRRDVILPVLFNNSRYADRLPIGKMETVRAATQDRLRQLYARWYRPERMALIAVGDFDANTIVSRIRSGFESWTNPTAPGKEPEAAIRPYSERSYHFFDDPEQTYNIVQLARMEPARPIPYQERIRLEVLRQMTKNALDQRLELLTQTEDPPFLSAFYDWSNFARRFWITSIYTVSAPNRQVSAFEASMREVERLRRYGFSPRELEREKSAMEQELQILLAQEQDRTHGEWANDLVDAFLNRQALPSLQTHAAATRKVMDQIALEEWNRFATESLVWDNSRVFSLTNTATGQPPTQTALDQVLRASVGWNFERFETVGIDQLVKNPPAAAAITDTRTWPELQLTRWRLANGTEVYFKKTDFKQEEVLIRAYRPGGLGLAEDNELPHAAWTTDLLSESNLGGWAHSQLLDYLADKSISLELNLDEAAVWITGSAVTRHLETWFQFLYLRLTQMQPSESSFRSVQNRIVTMAQSRQNNPELRFQDHLNILLRGGPARARTLTPEAVRSADFTKVVAWDRRFFGSGAGWVYVIVGDFNPDQLERQVRVWLGNVPNRGTEAMVDRRIQPRARGPQILRAGRENKANVFVVLPFREDLDIQELVSAQALTEIFNIRLRDTIREELGGTYSIRFDFQYRPKPSPNGFAYAQFGTNIADYERLLRTLKQELARVRDQGVSADEVGVFRQIRLRDLEQSRRQNSFWASNITSYLFAARDLNILPRFVERVEAVTPGMVAEVARKILKLEDGFEAIHLPENR